MPILWRYLLSHYLKILLFSVLAFIAILLTTRAIEIANFAAIGGQSADLFWFILYQIPYILPIVIPVSCLISSWLVLQKLSHTHELIALRTAGLSLRDILAPLLIAASFFVLFNFYIVSELSTQSHLAGSQLKQKLHKVNPLVLLQSKQFLRLQGFHFDKLGNSIAREFTSEAFLAIPQEDQPDMHLFLAGEMEWSSETLKGKNLTLISSLKHSSHPLDHFIIDNIGDVTIPTRDASSLIKNKIYSIRNDHLRLELLLARLGEERDSLIIEGIRAEIIRRISLAFAALSFTLLGVSFGLSIGRSTSYRSLAWTIGLSALYLVCFFAGKQSSSFAISAAFYLFPHLLILTCCLSRLKNISRGVL